MRNKKKAIIILLLQFLVTSIFAQTKVWELAYLAQDTYSDKPKGDTVLNDFIRESEPPIDGPDGFNAVIYGNKDTMIISYRGTSENIDLAADFEMFLEFFSISPFQKSIEQKSFGPILLSQIEQAKNVYEEYRAHDNRRVIIIGHSLGGFLAQIVGYIYELETHTFNAPGALSYVENMKGDASKITNHLSIFDPVSWFRRSIGKNEWYFNWGHSIERFTNYLKKGDYDIPPINEGIDQEPSQSDSLIEEFPENLIDKRQEEEDNYGYNDENDFRIARFSGIEAEIEYHYKGDERYVAVIREYIGTRTNVNIPPKINNLSVLAVQGFQNKQLTSVIIPNSVINIGSSAFENNRLTSVTIPNSVTHIEMWAFRNNQLTSVTIPDSVTYIGNEAFRYNKLTSVTIPNNAMIRYYAFADNQLTSVTLPDNIISIDSGAFWSNQLTSVTIGANFRFYWDDYIPYKFDSFYAANGRKAGTYTFDGNSWSVKYREGY